MMFLGLNASDLKHNLELQKDTLSRLPTALRASDLVSAWEWPFLKELTVLSSKSGRSMEF